MNYTEKTKLVDKVCGAALMAMLIEIFYSLVDASYTTFYLKISTVTTVVHVIGGLVLLASLIMLIIAYRKEKDSLAVYGTELLVFALTAGLLPATYTDFVMPFNKLNAVFPLAFGVYYIAKVLYTFSKRNLSNIIMLGIVEAVYIIMYVYGLLNLNLTIFMIGSVLTIIGFIYSIVKKSKFVLVHALEFMVFAFSFLLFDNIGTIVFFAVLMIIYYIFKSFFVTSTKNTNSKKKVKKRV